MTWILKPDLDMVKMYHHTKNEVSMLRYSKVIAQTDTHTDTQMDRQTDRHTHTHTQYENITFPHTWAVIIAYEIQLQYVIQDKIQSEKKSEKKIFCRKNNFARKKIVRKKFVLDIVLDFQCAK